MLIQSSTMPKVLASNYSSTACVKLYLNFTLYLSQPHTCTQCRKLALAKRQQQRQACHCLLLLRAHTLTTGLSSRRMHADDNSNQRWALIQLFFSLQFLFFLVACRLTAARACHNWLLTLLFFFLFSCQWINRELSLINPVPMYIMYNQWSI